MTGLRSMDVGYGVLISENAALVTLDLKSLRTLGGTITIVGNQSLQQLIFPALSYVSGSLSFSGNPNLRTIRFPLMWDEKYTPADFPNNHPDLVVLYY